MGFAEIEWYGRLLKRNSSNCDYQYLLYTRLSAQCRFPDIATLRALTVRWLFAILHLS